MAAIKGNSKIKLTRDYVKKEIENWYVQDTVHTPDGDLVQVTCYPAYNPPTHIEKYVKNLKEDFSKFRHLFSEPNSCDSSIYNMQSKALGDRGIMCWTVVVPGF